MPRSLARASHIITDSEFSRRDIEKRYGVGPDRITAIPLAASANLRPFSPEDIARVLSRYGLASSSLWGGSIGGKTSIDSSAPAPYAGRAAPRTLSW